MPPLRIQLFSIILCLVLVGISTATDPQSGDTTSSPAAKSQRNGITVEDVIKLSKAGLGDDLIIAQIKKRPHPFDLWTNQLIQLKSAHVSDRVIQAMTGSNSVGQQLAGMNTAATLSQPDLKAVAPGQGPFGFERGMSRQQVINLVGGDGGEGSAACKSLRYAGPNDRT